MVTASAQWIDGERFAGGATSGHALVIDSDRASNTASGPMELVLIALCACTIGDCATCRRRPNGGRPSEARFARRQR